ncbi:outer membrane beta-barrel protein [Microbulbifer sp. GL-2]|uniref:outer membrane beta-barrel protein n=1 Tax=Microbulbifer sp. GL-2 TaxID=2591606 RepID=UPI0011631C22|nr:outer membrane beta-barrel protein [Microbulbifer sp. GL-2]BBM01755.1 hypothetical protein GL2_18290 [Microbulbifer sp. GL-2]
MKRLILAAILATSASSSMAMENNFYLKSSFGKVDTDISNREALENFGVKLSDPKGWNVTLGYRLNNFLSIEGGYTNLGSSEGRDRGSDSINTDYEALHYEYDYKVDIDTQSRMLGIFLTTDITKNLYAGIRVGYQQWDAELKEVENLNWNYEVVISGSQIASESGSSNYSYKGDDDGSDPYYGISAGWNYNNWSLSLEHTIFEMGDRKPNFSSLALTYNF